MQGFSPRLVPVRPPYQSKNNTKVARQLREIGWTHKHAAAFFYRHEVTIARWASNDYMPSRAEEIMLQLLADNPEFRKHIHAIWCASHPGLLRIPVTEMLVELFEEQEAATS